MGLTFCKPLIRRRYLVQGSVNRCLIEERLPPGIDSCSRGSEGKAGIDILGQLISGKYS